MANQHYTVNEEVEVTIKVKVKELHNYLHLDEEGQKQAIEGLKPDLAEIVVAALNSSRDFTNYDRSIGYNGCADSYTLEAEEYPKIEIHTHPSVYENEILMFLLGRRAIGLIERYPNDGDLGKHLRETFNGIKDEQTSQI